MTEIKFECIHCHQQMLVSGDAAGMEVTCPSCATKVRVPIPAPAADYGERTAKSLFAGNGAEPSDSVEVDAPDERTDLRQEYLEARAENRRLQAQLADARAEIEKANASATHGLAEVKSFQSERLSLKSDLSQLRQKLATAEALLLSDAEAWHAETTRLEAENAVLSEQLQRGQEEIEALQTSLREREIEDAETQNRLQEVQAERMSAFREIESLRQKLGVLETELNNARGDRALFEETDAKLRQTEGDLASNQLKLATAQQRIAELEAEAKALGQQSDKLRQNLKKGRAGKELLLLQGQHAELTTDRDSLAGQVRQLTADLEAQEALRVAAVQEAKELRHHLEAALQQVEAQSDSRLRVDNDVLRGIVARQNSELEQRYLQLVRFKRAQITLRLVYALFGLGFILLGMLAVKFIPALHF